MAELKMRVALGQFNELTDDMLTYVKQLGADDFLMSNKMVRFATEFPLTSIFV